MAVKGDFTITTAEHDVETYKMGADSIEDNIKVLEEYGAMLDALKARGADESTLSSILNMDIEEGMEFGSKLLNMSDQAWNSYFDSLERLHRTAAEISAKYYQDEVNSLKENFVDKLRSAFDGMTSDMYQVGFDTAKAFVEGWNKQLRNRGSNPRRYRCRGERRNAVHCSCRRPEHERSRNCAERRDKADVPDRKRPGLYRYAEACGRHGRCHEWQDNSNRQKCAYDLRGDVL